MIRGATMLTIEDSKPAQVDMLLHDGKIMAIGPELLQEGAKVVSAKGLYCVPGIIDAHCHAGMQENGVGWEGRDTDEIGDPVAPHLRAMDALNPEDSCFGEALEGGVTTVAAGPGSANVLGGQFLLMKTAGGSLTERMICDCVALKAALGENPKLFYGSKHGTMPATRMGIAACLRGALREGVVCKEGQGGQNTGYSAKMEAIAGLLKGDYPLKVHLHRMDDIQTALRLRAEFGFRMSLEHATDAYRMADVIAREQRENELRLVLGQYLSGPKKVESIHRTAKAPAILAAHGVRFALMTDHPAIPLQYLSLQAGVLEREGLDRHIALRSITLDAAWTLGVEDRMGSLKPGKMADFALWEGHPLDTGSRVRQVYIDGRLVYDR